MALTDDAIHNYVLRLQPSARLKYYRLSKGEFLALHAMLTFSETGADIGETMETLAHEVNVDVKTMHNSIHGYKRRDGTEHRGLLARGILTQTAPPRKGLRKPAHYRINFEAFVIDPRRTGDIEERLQETLPGFKKAPVPDAHQVASESPGSNPLTGGKPVNPLKTSGIVPDVIGNSSRSERQQLPMSSATVADERAFALNTRSVSTGLDKSFSVDRGVVEIQPYPARAAKLQPWLLEKIYRELAVIHEMQVGLNTYGWSADQVAEHHRRNISLACDRAGVWPQFKAAYIAELTKGSAN